mgnify:CR=1 FL=1
MRVRCRRKKKNSRFISITLRVCVNKAARINFSIFNKSIIVSKNRIFCVSMFVADLPPVLPPDFPPRIRIPPSYHLPTASKCGGDNLPVALPSSPTNTNLSNSSVKFPAKFYRYHPILISLLSLTVKKKINRTY